MGVGIVFNRGSKKKLVGDLLQDSKEVVGWYLRWLQEQDLSSTKELVLFSHDIGLEIEVLRYSLCKFLDISSELGCIQYSDISNALIHDLGVTYKVSKEYKSAPGASSLVQACVHYMSYLREKVGE